MSYRSLDSRAIEPSSLLKYVSHLPFHCLGVDRQTMVSHRKRIELLGFVM